MWWVNLYTQHLNFDANNVYNVEEKISFMTLNSLYDWMRNMELDCIFFNLWEISTVSQLHGLSLSVFMLCINQFSTSTTIFTIQIRKGISEVNSL